MSRAFSALGGVSTSPTLRAMRSAPNYWLAWYTAKSLAAAGFAALAAYLVGKERGRKERREEEKP